MEKITNTIELIEAIRLLEIQQKEEELLLKEQFKVTYESLQPASLIKNTIKNFIEKPNLKANLLSMAFSIAAGYASKKIVEGKSKSPVKHFLGSLLQMGVTSLVANKSDGLISGISNFFKNASLKNQNQIIE